MQPGELRFRVACGGRRAVRRLATAVQGSSWRREEIPALLVEHVDGAPDWASGIAACRSADYRRAHSAFAAHFRTRASVFPMAAREVPARAACIGEAFPEATHAAAGRAEAILEGRYDLLGYRNVRVGEAPDWHLDPVHGRRSPLVFWTRVRYLDAALGDHKIIWELNRHQHWMALGRATALTGERRFYLAFTRQLTSWLSANPPLMGTNWTSMLELAFRVCSWIWALEFFAGCAGEEDTDPWLVDLLHGIDRQLRHVEENLSRFFSPNTHLSGEALALFVAGTCLPELKEGHRRAGIGRDVLVQEARRQLRGDGGHAELSAHYHRYSTDFYLLACAVARRAGDPAAHVFEDAARRQARYLRTICDDAGRRPQVGDDDGGQLLPICGRDPADCSDTLATASLMLNEPALAVAAAPEETWWLCGATDAARSNLMPWPSTALRDSGYFVSRSPQGDHLLFDAGPFGFLNGGHAHADALSCTVTAASRPVLIDPGTATYTMSPEVRDRFRSPMMHNTVVLDGRSHSMPHGPFHWASRVDARATVWRSAAAADYVEGTHDGYAPHRHTRAILALHGVGWLIVDHVLGPGPASVAAYWHVHPMWQCGIETPGRCRLQSGDTALALASSTSMSLHAPGSHPAAVYSPAYGSIEAAPVLCTTARVDLPWCMAAVLPATAAVGRGLSVEEAPLQIVPEAGWHGRAFGVAWDGGTLLLLSAVEEKPRSEDAAPNRVWGTGSFQTDARFAVCLARRGRPTEILAVNATLAATPSGMLPFSASGRVPLYVGAVSAAAPGSAAVELIAR